MGSVTPLIAVAEVLKSKNPGSDLFWIGTRKGPEEKMVRHYNIEFKKIYSGKLRRYFSWQNFLDIFRILIGFIQSIILLLKIRPRVIVSAGGFVAVPVVWAGWLLNIPTIIHQQDVQLGLANKLCSLFAKKITVCFPESEKYFNRRKTEIVGNPVRMNLKNGDKTKRDYLFEKLGLDKDRPLVLITTGGTGSLMVNSLVYDGLKQLVEFCQVIHVTGKNKPKDFFESENYISYEFLVNIVPFLLSADLIVSRAGMATLTEISYLSKPAIIIPIPRSHQVYNASYFYKKGAIELLEQEGADGDDLIRKIKELLNDKNRLKELGYNIHQAIKWGAEGRLADIIEELAG